MQVRRFDNVATLGKATKTPEGFLRAPARLTRVGVFSYRLPNGQVRRELRLPEEVFNADSLASFELLPLTNDHPRAGVNPKNAGAYQVGSVGHVKQDGEFVSAMLLVTDAKAIADVESGKNQISNGYGCRLEMKSGIWTDGAGNKWPYDAIQRDIRGNHVAIVDEARAGPEAKIQLDSVDGVQVTTDGNDLLVYEVGDLVRRSGLYVDPDSYEGTISERREDLPGYFGMVYRINFKNETGFTPPKSVIPWDTNRWYQGNEIELVPSSKKQDGIPVAPKGKKKMKIRYDGKDFEIDDEVGEKIAKERADAAGMVQAAQGEATKERARADAAEKKLAETQKKLEEANDPKKLESALANRVKLYSDAIDVLGSDTKLDGLDDLGIRKMVLGKLAPDEKFDGEDVDQVYVRARFDAEVKHWRKTNPATAEARKRIDVNKTSDEPAKKTDSTKADHRRSFYEAIYSNQIKAEQK